MHPKQHKGEGRHIIVSWHRFYDPSTGRYISADPIGLRGGMNLFAYVNGNPVNAVDPEGLINTRKPTEPPGKPEGCGKSCCKEDGTQGTLKCTHVESKYRVTGDFGDVWKHNTTMHPTTRIWNPTYCFKEPHCGDGWTEHDLHYYNSSSGRDVHYESGAPAHDGCSGACFEMQSRDWLFRLGSGDSRMTYGRWCSKCE